MPSNSKKNKIGLSVAIVIVIAAGAIYWNFFSPHRAVAVVGETRISQRDAEYRDKVVRIYYPEEKRNMGLYQLMKSARNIEILKSHGVHFTHEKIVAEYQRMLSESKDPKMLETIREVFGKDEDAFLRNFVLPTMADHFIYYEFFLMDPGVQGPTLKRAQEFIEFVGTNKSKEFLKLAEEKNIKTDTLTLSLKKGMLWAAQQKDRRRQDRDRDQKGPHSKKGTPFRRPGGPVKLDKPAKPPRPVMNPKLADIVNPDSVKDAEVWYDKLIKNMKLGEVFIEPVSMGEAFVVIHYAQKVSNDEFKIEAAFFPKENYAQWYSKEEAKIKTTIYDKSLIPKGL